MMIRWVLLCSLLWTAGYGRESGGVQLLSELPQETSIRQLAGVYLAKTAKTPHPADWVPPAASRYKPIQTESRHQGIDTVCWVRMRLANDFDVDTTVYFLDRYNPETHAYRLSADGEPIPIASSGYLVSSRLRNVKHSTSVIALRMAAGEHATVLLRIVPFAGSSVYVDPQLLQETGFLAYMLESYVSNQTNTIITNGFIWAVTCLALFMLFAYIRNRQHIYLFYSAYLLCNVVYATMHAGPQTLVGLWWEQLPGYYYSINYAIQFVGFALYNYFARELLDVKKHDPWIYRALNFLAPIYLVFAAIQASLIMLPFEAGAVNLLFLLIRLIFIPFNIYMVVRGLRTVRTPVMTYFAIGVSVFLIGGGIATYMVYRQVTLDGVMAASIFQLGILLEVICFAFALGYRIKLADEERAAIRQQYIGQLKRNHELEQAYSNDLKIEVANRTRELLDYRKQLEEQKAAELKLQYEKKLYEVENVALRAQMNPHFLFNSLNAIKYFILSRRIEEAASYLNRFSKLLRMILEYSKQELITLEEELEALRIYLEIESTRFDSSFSYRLEVESNVRADQLTVPPLLLQPFAENAIWHGLLPKTEGPKTLDIHISEVDKGFLFVVGDNGIGRHRAAAMERKTSRSFGRQITQERVDIFNRTSHAKIYIDTIDLPNHGGTRVEITYEV